MTVLLIVSLCFMGWVISDYIVGSDPWYFTKRRVYFLDAWGEIKTSGRLLKPGYAYLYGWGRIRLEKLEENGTIGNPYSYLVKWSYNMEDLV